MLNVLKLALVIGFCSCFLSCENSGTKIIEVKNQYSLDLPRYMVESTEEVSENVSLQYENGIRKVYVMVLEESKEEFIESFEQFNLYIDSISAVENYGKAHVTNLIGEIEVTARSIPQQRTINGLHTESIQIDGIVEGFEEEVTYFLTFIEGEKNMYYITSITLKDRKDKYLPVFENIANSFKLIGIMAQ